MINNRQNGRRRGRGGGPRTPNNAPGPGNRQDNRSRGNAVQLHEKYKALARDAQLAGDRVQTEYYLQFADHYFRVLSEGRARFEEQRPRRDDFTSEEDEDQDDVLADGEDGEDQQEERDAAYQPRREQRTERAERPERQERAERPERRERAERQDRPERQESADRPERADRTERAEGEQPRELRPRRPRRRREDEVNGQAGADTNADGGAEEGGERISLDSLPPAITVIEGGEETQRTPRRRTRRPRAEEGEAEIAPAA